MGSKTLFMVLMLSARSATVFGEDDGFKEEMEIYRVAIDLLDDCGSKDLTLCLKERALKYINNLPNELNVGEGFKLKPNGRVSKKSTIAKLPDEPRARENAVEAILWDRIGDYLGSHSIEFKVPPDTLQEFKKSVEEARSKGGGGGGKGGSKGGDGMKMKGMMMLFQLKVAMLGAIALTVIGLIAFKALLVAKIALTISSIIALKKLVEHKHHSSTYEVIAAHPHDDYGHYDRSFTQAQIAYNGYNGVARSKN